MIHAAAAEFGIHVKPGTLTFNHTGATVSKSFGDQRTRLVLLQDGDLELCLISSDLLINALPMSEVIKQEVGGILRIDPAHVVNFSTHNHSTIPLMFDEFESYHADRWRAWKRSGASKLNPTGRVFMRDLRAAAKRLRRQLEPVTIWYGQGREDRISYNRKGRRADGTPYFMREEDRVRIARDYRGDIDTEAPVVCLNRQDGSTVAAIVQFTAHPVTAFHPEQSVAHGDYPQVACDLLAEHLARDGVEPTVAFIQGCAGDVNSKQMFVGGVEAAERYGRYLGRTYVKTSRKLTQSNTDTLDFTIETPEVPFAPLPSRKTIEREIREMEAFVARAEAGDEDTRMCVGLNFPRQLTPTFRGKLVGIPLQWNQWALKQHRAGRADRVPRSLPMELPVIRIGDVGIVGMPCEPFQGIGRQIRAGSPCPLTIPAGYTNASFGYVPDGPNTGDTEYMSSFYRYTRFHPPFRKPGGDVLARAGVRALKRFMT